MKKNKLVPIHTEFITLGQFLKLSNCIDSGGHAKFFLQETMVKVDGEPEQRRGRKLFHDQVVEIEGFGSFQVEHRT